MARLLLFGPLRHAAGASGERLEAETVGELVAVAKSLYGEAFTNLLPRCRIWVNGEESDEERLLVADDEVAFLPPVSGG